ncbi:hypothetical protein C6P46_004695 [Rhodotorula mucilaginosa]|uniref:Uncharacterized protein n=1 Tax=Rhodotorula mucilaginosa TaxID=5537 RepID=A0A9P6W200_RHOMI|nr:hypothetical protein C6P46_004695 [Rhodotorula mucilaginosa]
MRTATAIAACAALLAAAPSAFAQLATMRGTIPGSLHQCEDTTVFFFDSGNASPKTLVLLPQGQGPSGDTTLADVEAIGPLQVIGDITTPDAQSFPFTLQIAAGVSFDTYGFLPDGTGKNLNLPRSVQTPLPGASQCNPASVGQANAAQPTSTSDSAAGMTTSTRAAASATSTNSPVSASSAASGAASSASIGTLSSASSAASSARSTSSSASAAAASGSTTPSSGAAPVAAVGVGAAFMALGAAVVAAL